MDSSSTDNEIIHDFPPLFKVYKDGRVERYVVTEHVPAGLDPKTGVQSKDVVVSPGGGGVKARIYMPQLRRRSHGQKLPVLVHYHAGGFCIASAFDNYTRKVLAPLVMQANVMAISIDYRLAPEHHLQTAYDDSWAGLCWVASHANGQGPEPWLNETADLGRVFLSGESAGANLAHYVAVQAGATPTNLVGLKIMGTLMVHPFFFSKADEPLYKYICPASTGFETDPKQNPGVDPNLKGMAGDRVIVMVAEKDKFRSGGEAYYQTLVKSGWGGKVEFFESRGEDHCFHFIQDHHKYNHSVEVLMKKMVDFMKKLD